MAQPGRPSFRAGPALPASWFENAQDRVSADVLQRYEDPSGPRIDGDAVRGVGKVVARKWSLMKVSKPAVSLNMVFLY